MRLRRQNGTLMIEVAIALPLFLLIVFSVMLFGWLINNYVTLNMAALKGAGILATERGYSTPYTDTKNQIVASVATFSGGRMNNGNLTITMKVGGTACSTDVACAGLLGTANTPPPTNTQANVSLSYTFASLLPNFKSPGMFSVLNCTNNGGSMPCALSVSASEFVQ